MPQQEEHLAAARSTLEEPQVELWQLEEGEEEPVLPQVLERVLGQAEQDSGPEAAVEEQLSRAELRLEVLEERVPWLPGVVRQEGRELELSSRGLEGHPLAYRELVRLPEILVKVSLG